MTTNPDIRMKRSLTAATIGIILLALLSTTAFAADKLPVFVSIVPQKYFVEQIGGSKVEVSVMVKPGASPATYEPKPKQMAQLSQAKIYFAIGVPFERTWLPRFTAANKGMLVAHTDEGIEKIPMAAHNTQDSEPASHNAVGDHQEHDAKDPHIWLSPLLVKIQARHILEALAKTDPANQSTYYANHQKFIDEINNLHIELKQLFAGNKGSKIMVFHPSWGYFTRTYGLQQIPIEIEGKKPKPAQLRDLIEHARKYDIRAIFIQPQFSTRNAQLIAKAIKAEVIIADPLAENWPQNLSATAKQFKAALK